MRLVDPASLTDAIARLCVSANTRLPPDIAASLAERAVSEPWPPARDTLAALSENAALAERRGVPICQDTGVACVFLDIGFGAHIDGDVYAAVNEGVRRGYTRGYLRSSIVADPLRRVNTGDNTPASVYIDLVPGDRVTVTVAPKGFGSENMSAVKMLKPSDGERGVADFAVSVAESAGASPCPPMVLGIGVGGTFDKCALLAKRALLRAAGEANPDPYYAALEREILTRVNALGIGPQGFGGETTALSAAILAAPTHIAGLPVAVNVSCHVTRHASEVL
ncbi:MAG: fumarate hydratase [Oscillospiraceae bacterium]|jgi:fumarate hydratase subunit alpha|nr:fumarate hydratase [Oscillospiraceae bacterium]